MQDTHTYECTRDYGATLSIPQIHFAVGITHNGSANRFRLHYRISRGALDIGSNYTPRYTRPGRGMPAFSNSISYFRDATSPSGVSGYTLIGAQSETDRCLTTA